MKKKDVRSGNGSQKNVLNPTIKSNNTQKKGFLGSQPSKISEVDSDVGVAL
jgi:hypothetical protein